MERVTEVQKLDDRIARLESDFQRKSTDFENFILNARNQKEKDELKLEGIRKSIQDASLRYESTTSEVKKLKLSISTTNAGLEDLSVHLQTSRLDFDTENNELEDQKKSMQEANEVLHFFLCNICSSRTELLTNYFPFCSLFDFL